MARKIVLGSIDFSAPFKGCSLRSLRLQGWDGGTPSSLNLTQRRARPGAWPSANPQLGARPLILTGLIVGPDPESVTAACENLTAAVTLTETTLSVTETTGGVTKTLRVRRSGDPAITGRPSQLVKAFSIGLVATDPRKVGTAQTLVTGLPSSTGGLTLPTTLPATIAATTVTGQVSLANPGTISGPVTIRVDGPCADFTVTHVAASGTHVFSLGLALAAGEWVSVDMEARTVLAQGQSSRTSWITARGWAGFEPGLNTWSFASSSATAAQMTVTATPAWE